jgi:ABC-2 type transport system ATP-binding protein
VTAAVSVSGLVKSYGSHEAVKGIDFEIGTGEVFGLLGPNGAGKTTTIEILEGYRERDGGRVEVLGLDPARANRAWRDRLGVVLQSSSLYPNLTVRESLRVFGGYFDERRDIDEVVEIVGLTDKADSRCRTLSGGQKRRLDLGLALIGNPELVFLDEPTTGLDPVPAAPPGRRSGTSARSARRSCLRRITSTRPSSSPIALRCCARDGSCARARRPS